MESWSWSTPSNNHHGGMPPHIWHPPIPATCDRCRNEELVLERTDIPCLHTLTCGRGAHYIPQAKNWWRYAAFIMCIPCLSLLATLAFMGMTLNSISFVPCRTIDVTAELNMCHDSDHSERYACIQSYRIVEWSLYDTKTKTKIRRTDRIGEATCVWEGMPTPACNVTSPVLLAQALSWLNVNQTCWIDSESGALKRSSTIAAADEEIARDSLLPYGLGLGAALLVSIFICGLWAHIGRLPTIYDERISDTRDHRHTYHTPEYMTLATFLMGFHHRCGGDTLRALRAHPHYDTNVTHLICQFADDAGIIPPHYDGHYEDSRIDMSRSDMHSDDSAISDSNDGEGDRSDDDDDVINDAVNLLVSPNTSSGGMTRTETIELLPVHNDHPRLSTNLVAAKLYSVDST